jgi:hypothetical protein
MTMLLHCKFLQSFIFNKCVLHASLWLVSFVSHLIVLLWTIYKYILKVSSNNVLLEELLTIMKDGIWKIWCMLLWSKDLLLVECLTDMKEIETGTSFCGLLTNPIHINYKIPANCSPLAGSCVCSFSAWNWFWNIEPNWM